MHIMGWTAISLGLFFLYAQDIRAEALQCESGYPAYLDVVVEEDSEGSSITFDYKKKNVVRTFSLKEVEVRENKKGRLRKILVGVEEVEEGEGQEVWLYPRASGRPTNTVAFIRGNGRKGPVHFLSCDGLNEILDEN